MTTSVIPDFESAINDYGNSKISSIPLEWIEKWKVEEQINDEEYKRLKGVFDPVAKAKLHTKISNARRFGHPVSV